MQEPTQSNKNKHASQKQKIQPDFQISEYMYQKHKKQSLNIKKKFQYILQTEKNYMSGKGHIARMRFDPYLDR